MTGTRERSLAPNDGTAVLPDGRRLGYAEWGDSHGRPVLDFHGVPASRLQGAYAAVAAAQLGIRLLSVDRPGMGLSDRRPGYTISDWPDDVAAFADALGLGRFGVLAWSGGGPYALGCAARIPERLTAVGVVAGMGPGDDPETIKESGATDRMLFFLSRRAPLLARAALRIASRQSPVRAMKAFKREVSPADGAVLDEEHARTGDVMAFFRESVRRDGWGVVDDYRALAQAWQFRPEDITVEAWLWHGDDDRTVPVERSRQLAARMPRAHLKEYPGEGHLIYVTHAEEILQPFTAG